jgi:hypothetical protein
VNIVLRFAANRGMLFLPRSCPMFYMT